jgi:hypothetical protein
VTGDKDLSPNLDIKNKETMDKENKIRPMFTVLNESLKNKNWVELFDLIFSDIIASCKLPFEVQER